MLTRPYFTVFLLLLLPLLHSTEAFSGPSKKTTTTTTTTPRTSSSSKIGNVDNDNDDDQYSWSVPSRRRFFSTVSTTAATMLAVDSQRPRSAYAAGSSQADIDKANIVKGYQRLQYLLDNWEKETTVCGMGGDKLERSCERTPLKVMDYLGYKATNDPLFKAEKTLRRLYPLAPADRDVEFLDAVEAFAENADEASSMAFVSSWGEANPGGGKDRVELFIERSKRNVTVARDSLATVIDILGLNK
jgi:hypothetical protein